MTNKIKMSTIRKEADVQVIELTASLVTRVVESEILLKETIGSMTSLECACDNDTPTVEVNGPTLTYWKEDLEKVWELVKGLKNVFLYDVGEEDKKDNVGINYPEGF